MSHQLMLNRSTDMHAAIRGETMSDFTTRFHDAFEAV